MDIELQEKIKKFINDFDEITNYVEKHPDYRKTFDLAVSEYEMGDSLKCNISTLFLGIIATSGLFVDYLKKYKGI